MNAKSSDAYTENELRNALQMMVDAAQNVMEAWESGDLAGAVHMLECAAVEAKALLTE